MLKPFLIALLLFTTGAISAQDIDFDQLFTPQIIEKGAPLYQENCAICHGAKAESTVENWHEKGANGKMPPPPLNGSAHTWHHPIGSLIHTIKNGTESIGGSMPGWGEKLSDEEVVAILAWITSLWPEQIFTEWKQRHQAQ